MCAALYSMLLRGFLIQLCIHMHVLLIEPLCSDHTSYSVTIFRELTCVHLDFFSQVKVKALALHLQATEILLCIAIVMSFDFHLSISLSASGKSQIEAAVSIAEILSHYVDVNWNHDAACCIHQPTLT